MKSVLIAFASRMGSTAEIAEAIGRVLEESGLDVTVSPCSHADTAAKFDAAFIGSALYLRRWEKDAVNYLEQQAVALAARPTWLFQSGPCGEGSEHEEAETPRRVLRLAERLGIDPPVTFGGRLDRSNATGPISRWMATGALAGDYRDWEQIRSWAADRAAQLAGVSQ